MHVAAAASATRIPTIAVAVFWITAAKARTAAQMITTTPSRPPSVPLTLIVMPSAEAEAHVPTAPMTITAAVVNTLMRAIRGSMAASLSDAGQRHRDPVEHGGAGERLEVVLVGEDVGVDA